MRSEVATESERVHSESWSTVIDGGSPRRGGTWSYVTGTSLATARRSRLAPLEKSEVPILVLPIAEERKRSIKGGTRAGRLAHPRQPRRMGSGVFRCDSVGKKRAVSDERVVRRRLRSAAKSSFHLGELAPRGGAGVWADRGKSRHLVQHISNPGSRRLFSWSSGWASGFGRWS